MRCAFPVLRVLGQVAHVVVDAGEQGEEGLAVHREGGAHQLVSDFVRSLRSDFLVFRSYLYMVSSLGSYTLVKSCTIKQLDNQKSFEGQN